MRYVPDRDVLSLGLVAVGVRLFFDVAIDQPGLLNAGWLTTLGACALTLPLAFCLYYLRKTWAVPPSEKFTGWAARAFALILCLFSLYDCGCALRLFILSAQHTALESIHPWLLIPLLALAAGLCCLTGAQAVSSAARVSLGILAVMMVIIVAVQLRSLNVRWLTPVLGPGVDDLAQPLPHLAGLMTSLVPLWLLKGSSEKRPKALSMPALTGYIALAVSLLLVLFYMLAPMMTGVPDTRLFRFDRLLTNGRVSISLQLVLLLAWHAGLMINLAFSLVCSARMLHIVLPRLKWHWLVWACALVSLAVPLLSLSAHDVIEGVNTARWPLVTLPILGAALAQAVRARKEKRS